MNLVKTKFICLAALVLGLFFILTTIKPYGPKHLPVWAQQGNRFVEAVESFRHIKGQYPEQLPIDYDLKEIPGCRNVVYTKGLEDGREYYRIVMQIHLREAVIYDSRKNLTETDSWGTYQILNDWFWTKD